jgi:hypothetical protein
MSLSDEPDANAPPPEENLDDPVALALREPTQHGIRGRE